MDHLNGVIGAKQANNSFRQEEGGGEAGMGSNKEYTRMRSQGGGIFG